ncbi:MAG: PAC2 family protein [Acidobacteriota bacterium]|nr:PAC2 family protein [Acidobacteriota bacterium]
MKSYELMNFEEDVNCYSPILLTHLSGATDAGSAGALAIEQLLSSLPVKRVATFDVDRLIDYRANRPTVTINNWEVMGVDIPEIALDLVQDDAGIPILVLHGPEPDQKWQRFAEELKRFTEDAGVEIVVSMTGMPAAVPHTRPTMVHLQSTDPDLVEGQPQLAGGEIQFSASANTFVHHALAEDGVEGVTFLAAVPYYMANMDYPRASLALLESMSSVLDLNLPTGNIEAGTQMVGDQLEQLVTENPEVVNLVGMLEKHFDEEISDEVKEIGGFPSPEDFAFDLEDAGDLLEPSIDTDALAHTIEQFLARTDSTTPPPSQEEEDPGRPRPRHRAPRPWEQDD